MESGKRPVNPWVNSATNTYLAAASVPARV
jgi:hypothetical protein